MRESEIKIPNDSIIQSVTEAYERGQTVEALRRARAFAPLDEWAGVWPCVLASRIASNCAAPRLAARLTVRAWRADKRHPEALSQYGYEILTRRGPLAFWQLTREWEQQCAMNSPEWAELLALKSRLSADLRDFAAAEALLSSAEKLAPTRPWVRLQRAHLLEIQDRVEESVEVARSACALHPHPHYRAGVQTLAHLLQLLDRDDEAIQLLKDADAALQNGMLSAQLYAVLSENNRWTEAEEALERHVTLCELMEKPGRKWVSAQRARLAYHLGRRSDAARFALELDDTFHRNFAARLGAAPPERERMQLDVTFVRQHFKTCAPATLAAIGRFWRMPADHLTLAEAMCYDGTPHWQQRDWAEKNGWQVREFRVTLETAVALIERGIPFAISVVEASSAHMMAVIGFDLTRGTLLLRDPGQPYVIETSAEDFLKRYRPFGPHGMVFVPEAERTRLDGVMLPETSLHDDYHQFWLALAKHDRVRAANRLRMMEASSAEETLTWEARLDLAGYDANTSEQARCLDKLLELFPNNAARLLRRLNCLGDAPRDERTRFIEAACREKEADPALFIAFGRALLGDARRHAEARQWLRRALRFRPMDTTAISALADLRWEDGALDEATCLFRFAANLESYREQLYQTWFIVCRRTRRTQEALTHLQDRFQRFGSRSEQPALTLAWAWREMEEPARAREVLKEAIRLRPDDGYLLLRAASLVTNLGEIAEGRGLLDSAKARVRENDWLRTSAELAEVRFEFEDSLRCARELLQREPLALDAHAAVTRILARREGKAAALVHLKEASAAFPHHIGLRRMVVEWSRDAGRDAVAAAARALLSLEPSDAWAFRELALALAFLKNREAAVRAADEAVRIEPRNSYSYSVLGHVHRQFGEIPEARVSYRRAVELSVDNGEAVTTLLELARTDTERKEELELVERELIRQVVSGDGLLAFLEMARPILDAETLLRSLRQAHAERPDLWHAWSAIISHLGHLGRLEEALVAAKHAIERFRHLPVVWLDLALVHQWRNEPDEETAAARHAFEMNPAWNRSTLMLANALERRNLLEDALQIYERALQHSSQDAQLHACRANLLWRQRQSEAACSGIERALRLAPAYEWAWSLFFDWSTQCGEVKRPAEFARALTRERAGEARVWMILARILTGAATNDERLAAIERAIELDPRSTEAWDLKAELLSGVERFEEAIQACTQGAAACTVEVHLLRGRHAWIEAQRRRLPEAIRLMRGVLAENVNYLWGWQHLAAWLGEEGALADATSALEQLQRLRPHDAWVNRQLGFLRLKQDDRSGAQTAFATALKSSPTDASAAHNLFDLQLQSSDLKGAAETLQVMQIHQPGAATMAAELHLQLRQKSDQVPARVLEALCVSPDPDPWPMDAAADAMQRAQQSADALCIFRRALKSGACNPQVATAAVRLLLNRESPIAATWLFARLRSGELQRRAAAPLVQGLAAQKSNLALRWLLWRRRDVLFKDDAAWGHVGYVLSKWNRMKKVAHWLADWRRRNSVQPWMLFNLCLALRHLGRYDEATEVARHVVKTWGHRDGSADMRLFLAVEDALTGDVRSAEEHLRHVVARDDVAYDQEILALTKALIEFQLAVSAERRKVFRAVRARLSQRIGPWRLMSSMRDVRQTFRRAGTLFHREGAGAGAWLWFRWSLYWQWSLLPLLPILVVFALQPVALVGLLIWGLTRGRKR